MNESRPSNSAWLRQCVSEVECPFFDVNYELAIEPIKVLKNPSPSLRAAEATCLI